MVRSAGDGPSWVWEDLCPFCIQALSLAGGKERDIQGLLSRAGLVAMVPSILTLALPGSVAGPKDALGKASSRHPLLHDPWLPSHQGPQPSTAYILTQATAGQHLLKKLSRHQLCMWASHFMGLGVLLCKLGRQKEVPPYEAVMKIIEVNLLRLPSSETIQAMAQ